MTPEQALSYYQLEGAVDEIAPFGLGHINNSFQVKTSNKCFLLQRINVDVFKNAAALEENLKLILAEAPQLFPEYILSKEGNYHVKEEHELWRLQRFIEGAFAPASINSDAIAYQIGLGFGSFIRALFGLRVDQVQESIPGFLNLGLRLQKFQAVAKRDEMGRAEQAKELIEKAKKYAWIWDHLCDLKEKGLPSRVCHNDTKGTNILLSDHDFTFQKVIDLDTVGPGHVLFDYGDMIRSIAIQTSEGDRDGLKQKLQRALIESNKCGFLDACGHLLSEIELETLDFGPFFMTYFTGIRMLTDFMEGDVYYKIHHWDDNLVRARNQFYILDLLNAEYRLK